jgi:hypothetical protein
MLPIEPRKLVSKFKKDDFIPDAIQHILSVLPSYDGQLPELDYVLDSLKKNSLPPIETIDESLKNYESDDDSNNANPRPKVDIFAKRRQKKLKQ